MKNEVKPEYVFEMTIKVRDYEVDAEGIVNNSNYLRYMEHTRHEYCIDAGFSFREMLAEGIVPVVRRVEIDYISSLGLGDTMVSCIAVERRGARFIFVQDIYEAESRRPVAHGLITIVCVENGRPSRGDRLAERLMNK